MTPKVYITNGISNNPPPIIVFVIFKLAGKISTSFEFISSSSFIDT